MRRTAAIGGYVRSRGNTWKIAEARAALARYLAEMGTPAMRLLGYDREKEDHDDGL